jgi:hypothetical protein
MRSAVFLDGVPIVREGVATPGLVRERLMIAKIDAALSCLFIGALAALFIFITARRAFEGDLTGTAFAAALSMAFIWMTVRAFRRWRRT